MLIHLLCSITADTHVIPFYIYLLLGILVRCPDIVYTLCLSLPLLRLPNTSPCRQPIRSIRLPYMSIPHTMYCRRKPKIDHHFHVRLEYRTRKSCGRDNCIHCFVTWTTSATPSLLLTLAGSLLARPGAQ